LGHRFVLVGLALLLVLSACSRSKSHLTLYVQYQKADTDACLACKHCGAEEEEIRKAFEALSRQLADKGIRVELVERERVTDTSQAEVGPGQMWIGEIPVETWLGGASHSDICPACPAGPHGHGHVRKSLVLDNQTLDQIPVDLMVRAGNSAAQHLLQNGKIDPQKLPHGCGGCPAASTCPKAPQG
jgi:ferredoxin